VYAQQQMSDDNLDETDAKHAILRDARVSTTPDDIANAREKSMVCKKDHRQNVQ
jgi:hypothetical protein